ncbi:MAG: T9SS type A sorting domain-containing protein [Leeuwenhoekiella sp.]
MKNSIKSIVFLICGYCFSQSEVVQIEYFIEDDLGVGLNTLVAVTSGEDIEANILAAIPENIEAGNHKMFYRVKDENNHWSHTVRRNLFVAAPEINNSVLKGEYIIDQDFAFGTGTSFEIDPQETDIEQAFLTAIPNNLSLGYHKLFGRVQDATGSWSHTFRRNIQVAGNNDPVEIVDIEYFFVDGGDPTFGLATPEIPEVEADISETFRVDYPAGNYDFEDVLFVRVKDSEGHWSQTTILDEIDENLSVAITESVGLSVFPNPFKDKLFLISKEATIYNSRLYDNLGRLVFTSNKFQKEFNLIDLQTGVYFLNVQTDQGVTTIRIVKK